MAPTLGSSISSAPAGSSSAEPLLEAATAVSASDSQSWPLWKWLATGVGIYGGLVLLGWLTKPDPSEEAAAAAKGKGPAAQSSRPGARKGASAPRLNRAQLPQINEQIQELCNHQEFDAAERVVKLMMEQLELELQTTPDPEILLEMFGFQKKLADIYRRSGKLAEAESQLEQLYMEFEQLRAPPVELSLLKQELSGVAEERNNLEKSERLMKEALKLWEQAEGPNSINSWPMIYKLSLFRKQAGASSEAQAYLQKAIQVLELAPRTNTQAQAIIGQLRLEGIDLLMEQDKLEQADAAIDELLEEVVKGSFKAKTPTYIGELGRMWFDHRLYDRAESLLKRGLAFEGLPSSERVELLNDLANVYVESDRSEEALTLQTELKTLPDGAPLTDSRFFKTAEATPENNKYRLLLSIKATTGPKALLQGVLVDAHYEAIEGSDAFTISKVVDEETLKKKELDLSSEDLEALPALPRFVQVTIWKDDTKSQRLGVHTQLVKRTVPKPLTPFISFATDDEEEASSSNDSSSSASAPPPLEDAEQGKEETTGEPIEESEGTKAEGAVGSEAQEAQEQSPASSTQEEAEEAKTEPEPEVEAGRSEENTSGKEEAEEKKTSESESESQKAQVVIEDATEEEDAFEATLASATPDQ